MNVHESNLIEMCRCCKQRGTAMASIYDENCNDPGYPRIDEMLMACATINVQHGDGLPSVICLSCLGRVKIAYAVKQELENTDSELRLYLKSKNTPNVHNQDKDANSELMNSFLNDFFQNTNTSNENPEIQVQVQVGKPLEIPKLDVNYENDNNISDELVKLQGNLDIDEGYLQIKCRQCVKTFTTLESYKSHTHTPKNVKEKHIFTCKQCDNDKQYRNLRSLRRHERRFHENSKMFACTICSKQFSRIEHLKRHLYTHLKEKPFPCDKCTRRFNRLEHLTNHYALCDGSRLLACDICNKGFARAITLELHKKMHENYNFEKMAVLDLADLEHFEKFYTIVDAVNENDDSDEVNDDDEGPELGENNLLPGRNQVTTKTNVNQLNSSIKVEPLEEEFGVDVEIHDSDSAQSEYKPGSRKSPRVKRKKRRTSKSSKKRGRPPKIQSADSETVVMQSENQDNELEPGQVPEQENFECPICNETFTRITLLEAHGKEHHENEKVLGCKICEQTFSRVYALNSHVQTQHQQHPTMKMESETASGLNCNACCKMFQSVAQLEEHKLQENHDYIDDRDINKSAKKMDKRFQCEKCTKAFTTEKYLLVHVKKHDEAEENNFVCPKCLKPFLSKSNLTEHMKFHNDKSKKFLCSECGQRFIRNDYLVIHMRRHRGEKPFKCKFCGKGFPRATDLTVHERYHTGEKTHLCVVCGRGFGRAYNLTVHMRTHTGEKPYKCTYCESAFAQCQDLKAHVRRHTGERFQCDLCSETFIMGYALTQHKRTAHGLNIVSNIRRLQLSEKQDPDAPTPTTVKLPRPVVPAAMLPVIPHQVPDFIDPQKMEPEYS